MATDSGHTTSHSASAYAIAVKNQTLRPGESSDTIAVRGENRLPLLPPWPVGDGCASQSIELSRNMAAMMLQPDAAKLLSVFHACNLRRDDRHQQVETKGTCRHYAPNPAAAPAAQRNRGLNVHCWFLPFLKLPDVLLRDLKRLSQGCGRVSARPTLHAQLLLRCQAVKLSRISAAPVAIAHLRPSAAPVHFPPSRPSLLQLRT